MSVRDVLDRTDLAAVLTELAGEPVNAGRFSRWRCCATDHDDANPSVTMFRDRHGVERWRCWSEGHGGTAVDAVMVARHVSTAEAVRQLEQRAGITPTVRPVGTPPAIRRETPVGMSDAARTYATACAELLWTPAGAGARDWLHRRGLTDEVLRTNMVGYDPGPHRLARPEGLPRHRGVTYPSFSADGNAIYVQCRRLDPDAPYKYANPTAAHGPLPAISFPRQVTPAPGPLIVTEGVPDGLIAVTAGFRAAAVVSASLVSEHAADELATHAGPAGVVLAFDNDPAGRAAQTKLSQLLHDRVPVKVLRLAEGNDLTDTYTANRPSARLTAVR